MKVIRYIVMALTLLLVGLPGFSHAEAFDSTAALTSSPVATNNSSIGLLNSLSELFRSESKTPVLLPPEQAFQVAFTARDRETLVATLTAADGYFLYRDQIQFSVDSPSTVAITDVSLPRGVFTDDPIFGRVEVFFNTVEVLVKLSRPAGDTTSYLDIRAAYQGCYNPLALCYPPEETVLMVALTDIVVQDAPASLNAKQQAPSMLNESPVDSANVPVSESSVIRDLFAQDSTWALIAAFFGFGLVLAFTPCMLPMIPILSGIIVGQGDRPSRRYAFALSLIYVLAMAVTYALAGVAAGLAGTMLIVYLQNPWVLGSFATVFVMLALSMFGFYRLQMPASLQSRLAGAANGRKGGKVFTVFVMGVLSAVIVGPCVAAPLVGALLYIGQTGDVVLGGLALFTLAIGMGVPLLVFGTTAGALLPKAGAWMKSVQYFFGVMMLAVAIYLISPIIPAVIHMILWAILLIISAMYLKALDPLPELAPGSVRFGKGVGIIALTLGLALFVGALSGSRDILQPLSALGGSRVSSSQDAVDAKLEFQKVASLADLEVQLEAANGRYVMLDFWAEWCVSCKQMEYLTFTDMDVKNRLKDVVLLKADVTANNAEDKALLSRFGLFGPPGIIFFDRQGKEIDFQVVGFQSANKFLRSLDTAIPI